MSTVAIIDYGMGNLHSVAKALEHVGEGSLRVVVTADPAIIASADRVVFPGVGAIRDCMAEINRLNVGEMVAEAMRSKPVLAICVGMQALMQHSEENGGVDCLGLMPGRVRYFGEHLEENGQRLKVPHMGWNKVRQHHHHPLFENIPDDSRFYFVHSYYVEMRDAACESQDSTKSPDADQGQCLVTGSSHYGREFVATVASNNIFATQFHPEKSQTVGLQLLRNFLQWDGAWQLC